MCFHRAFVYLTNLLHGLPLVQNVAIVSERGEIKGYLKIAVQQLQNSTTSPVADVTSEQIKLMRNYRNASTMTKINFDDETYFQVSLWRCGGSEGNAHLSLDGSGCQQSIVDWSDQILRFPGSKSSLRRRTITSGTERYSPNKISVGLFLSTFQCTQYVSLSLTRLFLHILMIVEDTSGLLTSEIPPNEALQQLGVEYQFRVTVLEASQISSDYADIFCQFNFLHQHQEAYSTEPLKNQGKPGPPLGFFHVQNVSSPSPRRSDERSSLVHRHCHPSFYWLSPIETNRLRSDGSLSRALEYHPEQVTRRWCLECFRCREREFSFTTNTRSSTAGAASVAFSKPVPAQTLNPMAPIKYVVSNSSLTNMFVSPFSPNNQVHATHDLLVWYEIFELSPTGE